MHTHSHTVGEITHTTGQMPNIIVIHLNPTTLIMNNDKLQFYVSCWHVLTVQVLLNSYLIVIQFPLQALPVCDGAYIHHNHPQINFMDPSFGD